MSFLDPEPARWWQGPLIWVLLTRDGATVDLFYGPNQEIIRQAAEILDKE